MNNKGLIISPKTKIGEILSTYPELEKILIDLSPAFKNLKNPVLKRTIGKVATLQQAALIANIPVNTIVNALRKEIGQEEVLISELTLESSTTNPEWIDEDKIKLSLNAIPIVNSGKNPVDKIFKSLENLKKGDILLLITPFIPVPILDILKRINYKTFTLKVAEEEFRNYILKTD